MDSTEQVDNETVTEWRERLPEVPLAVAEEGDPFRVALPRALVTGAALAILGAAAFTATSVLFHALNRHLDAIWTNRQALGLSEGAVLLGLVVSAPVRLAVMLALYLWIAGRIGAKYERLTYIRANNRAAAWTGIVVAGTGMGLVNSWFKFLATDHGLLPPSNARGMMAVFFFLGSILALQLMVLVAWQPYWRRHCPRCGGLFTLARSLSTCPESAEQLVAAQSAASAVWSSASEEYPDGNPDGADVMLRLYCCEACSARLLEGSVSLKSPEQKDNWDVTWCWLSAVYSREETAAFEASFRPRAFLDRLLHRR